ncbi:MAG: hypothetical protein SWJ54_02540 [Cyanobacteriota bacterium]|nr:hypothetical protein [Cyanobacteriota bacterium]
MKKIYLVSYGFWKLNSQIKGLISKIIEDFKNSFIFKKAVVVFVISLFIWGSYFVFPSSVHAVHLSDSTPLMISKAVYHREVQQVLDKIKNLEPEFRNMNRNSSACIDKMNKNRAKVDRLIQGTSDWNTGEKVAVGSILSTLKQCSSCLPSAVKYCNLVQEFVEQAEQG